MMATNVTTRRAHRYAREDAAQLARLTARVLERKGLQGEASITIAAEPWARFLAELAGHLEEVVAESSHTFPRVA